VLAVALPDATKCACLSIAFFVGIVNGSHFTLSYGCASFLDTTIRPDPGQISLVLARTIKPKLVVYGI
jgi:hypothetical protein